MNAPDTADAAGDGFAACPRCACKSWSRRSGSCALLRPPPWQRGAGMRVACKACSLPAECRRTGTCMSKAREFEVSGRVRKPGERGPVRPVPRSAPKRGASGTTKAARPKRGAATRSTAACSSTARKREANSGRDA